MSISPLYTIHQYREDIYKVVAFKRRSDPDALFLRDLEEAQHYDAKLDNNFSRARSMVLQYALCNPWDYFFTGTLDPDRWDRADLDTFMSQLSQSIRDWRKDYGLKVDVLLVPEHHVDGHWHVHGLINNLPSWCLYRFWWLPLHVVGLNAPFPRDLCRQEEWRYWGDFADKFGYCCLAPVKDPIGVAFYVSKYVSKDLSRRAGDLGKHLYFHSRPLRKAEKASDIYYPNAGLDRLCTHEYDFCRTGMVFGEDWTFPADWDGVDLPEAFPASVVEPQVVPETLEPPPEVWEQLTLAASAGYSRQ